MPNNIPAHHRPILPAAPKNPIKANPSRKCAFEEGIQLLRPCILAIQDATGKSIRTLSTEVGTKLGKSDGNLRKAFSGVCDFHADQIEAMHQLYPLAANFQLKPFRRKESFIEASRVNYQKRAENPRPPSGRRDSFSSVVQEQLIDGKGNAGIAYTRAEIANRLKTAKETLRVSEPDFKSTLGAQNSELKKLLDRIKEPNAKDIRLMEIAFPELKGKIQPIPKEIIIQLRNPDSKIPSIKAEGGIGQVLKDFLLELNITQSEFVGNLNAWAKEKGMADEDAVAGVLHPSVIGNRISGLRKFNERDIQILYGAYPKFRAKVEEILKAESTLVDADSIFSGSSPLSSKRGTDSMESRPSKRPLSLGSSVGGESSHSFQSAASIIPSSQDDWEGFGMPLGQWAQQNNISPDIAISLAQDGLIRNQGLNDESLKAAVKNTKGGFEVFPEAYISDPGGGSEAADLLNTDTLPMDFFPEFPPRNP